MNGTDEAVLELVLDSASKNLSNAALAAAKADYAQVTAFLAAAEELIRNAKPVLEKAKAGVA